MTEQHKGDNNRCSKCKGTGYYYINLPDDVGSPNKVKCECRETKHIFEELKNKPWQYHYTCWASGHVKVRDEWGKKPNYQCRSYDGDFNCGCRDCPYEDTRGIISGDLVLNDLERWENYGIEKAEKALKERLDREKIAEIIAEEVLDNKWNLVKKVTDWDLRKADQITKMITGEQ